MSSYRRPPDEPAPDERLLLAILGTVIDEDHTTQNALRDLRARDARPHQPTWRERR